LSAALIAFALAIVFLVALFVAISSMTTQEPPTTYSPRRLR